ncbi:MAG: hypothetical protein FD170_3316 [Bacteroidetes bacterium]|nr:MAG: hypothetical protein FD170_3316 [Bacteroidota bacterium]
MFKQNYYYLVAGLPDITIEQGKLQFGTAALREELKEGLSESDYQRTELLFLAEDNRNLLTLLLKLQRPLSHLGVYTPDVLANEILEPVRIKTYMKRFIDSMNDENRLYPNLSPENELATLWYEEMLASDHTFLRDWFTFELNLKNVLLVLSARKHGIPFEHQVIGNNAVAEIIRRSTARDLGLSSDWHWIEKVLQIVETEDILMREKAIDLLRWSYLDELNTFNYFSFEVLMAYYLKLGIIERWLQLDQSTGEEMFRKLLGELKNSYEFSNEFAIKDGRK